MNTKRRVFALIYSCMKFPSMLKETLRNKAFLLCLLIFVAGLFLRLYNINFGLPHVTFADEDKLGNTGIVYSYQLKNILLNKEFYKLAPEDFVYGTFSIYLNTFIIFILKIFLEISGKDITFLNAYTTLRIANAILSMIIIPTLVFLYFKIFKDKFGAIALTFLLSFNWKLIVHAHYLNADATLTILLALSFLTLYFYKPGEKHSTRFLVLTGLIVGFSVGTKITALISLPIYLAYILSKKQFSKVFLFLISIAAAFTISNPFSVIQADKFVLRIEEMRSKENGVVFDSVDFGRFKYIYSLSYLLTPLILTLAVLGIILILKTQKKSENYKFHLFLITNIFVYFIFFTLSTRRVDRWMLPILPILLLYASYSLSTLNNTLKRYQTHFLIMAIILFSLVVNYLYYPFVLLDQFKRYTPQTEAFLWAKQNIKTPTPKLLVTDSSLDPTRSIKGVKVLKVKVYSSQLAELQVPDNPYPYEYIIALSRPLTRYDNPTLKQIFPNYYTTWKNFDDTIRKSQDFELVKSFEVKEPNLIPLSSVYVYKNLKYIPVPEVQAHE